jgi:uncharacterized protein (TIRG00374 family)
MSKKSALTLQKLFRYALQGTVLGVVAMVGVLLFTAAPETIQELKNFPLAYLPLLFGLICCSWMLSGSRIWLLTRSLGYSLSYRRAIAVVLSMEFGISASPAGMGGPVILVSLLRGSGIPLASSASILAADMGVDAIFFLVFTPIGLVVLLKQPIWSSLRGDVGNVSLGVILIIFIMFGVMALGLVFGKKVRQRVERSPLGKKYRLAARFRHLRYKTKSNLRSSWEAILFLYRHRRLTLIANFILSIVQWFCRYAILPLIVLAFAGVKNPIPLLLIQCFLFTFGLMLVLPGGGGGIEVVTPLIIRHYVPLTLVGVVLILWRFFTYHLNILVGGTVFILSWNRLEDISLVEEEKEGMFHNSDNRLLQQIPDNET